MMKLSRYVMTSMALSGLVFGSGVATATFTCFQPVPENTPMESIFVAPAPPENSYVKFNPLLTMIPTGPNQETLQTLQTELKAKCRNAFIRAQEAYFQQVEAKITSYQQQEAQLKNLIKELNQAIAADEKTGARLKKEIPALETALKTDTQAVHKINKELKLGLIAPSIQFVLNITGFIGGPYGMGIATVGNQLIQMLQKTGELPQ